MGDFKKLKEAGAIVVKEPYNPATEGEYLVATFSDPDDNYFHWSALFAKGSSKQS
ncbi:MAG: hypothetical protein ACR2FO_08730 [Actinomycetota bacterium]